MIFDIYGKHGVMQPVASFEAIHLNGTKSQAALHGAATETMIGSNAPTRIKRDPRCLLLKTMHTMEHELTCELEGRFKVGYNLYDRRVKSNTIAIQVERLRINNTELTRSPF